MNTAFEIGDRNSLSKRKDIFVKSSSFVTFIAVCVFSVSAFCDPMGYTEFFTSNNATWKTDEELYSSDFLGTYGEVSWDSSSKSVWASYPALVGGALTKTTFIFADSQSSGGNLAGSEDYSSIPGVSVWLKLSTNDVVPGVTFFLATNHNTGSDTLNTSSAIWYAAVGAVFPEPATTWFQYTGSFTDTWVRLRGSTSYDFSDALADVDAIGVMMTDDGATTEELYVDNFTATPEPASLLLMGPMAGFLGWKVVRRKKGAPRRAS